MSTPGRLRGGVGTTSTPANNVDTTAAATASPTSPSSAAANAGTGSGSGRRSSDATRFAGLVNQKRNSSDASAEARRKSFSEQQVQGGFLGQLWNKYTKQS